MLGYGCVVDRGRLAAGGLPCAIRPWCCQAGSSIDPPTRTCAFVTTHRSAGGLTWALALHDRVRLCSCAVQTVGEGTIDRDRDGWAEREWADLAEEQLQQYHWLC